MANGPDPHGDFVIDAESSSGVPVAEQGADHPLDADGGTERPSSGPDAGPAGEEGTTAETMQPAATPLSARFGARESGT